MAVGWHEPVRWTGYGRGMARACEVDWVWPWDGTSL